MSERVSARANTPRVEMQSKPAPEPIANDGLGEIPHAYAIVEVAPGKWLALHLEGVTAKTINRLELNGMPEPAGYALMRCTGSMEQRRAARKWGRP